MSYIKFIFCGMLLLIIFVSEAYPQKTQVKNVHFVDKGKNIIVYYDLVGDDNMKYSVCLSIFIKRFW